MIDSDDERFHNGTMPRSNPNELVSLTIKDISRKVVDKLHRRAGAQNRSLNKEVIHILEQVADRESPQEQAKRQVAAWRALAGSWTGEDGRAIMDRRTLGRRVDL